MRILCCLDGSNIEQLHQAFSLLQTDGATIGLLYVIDSGPHGEMERQRERFFRSHGLTDARRQQIHQIEQDAAKDIGDEGQRYLPGAEILQREGRPEREIVNCAAAWLADLILISPRSPQYGGHPIGPKSVGHVARFVLDHAPCPVLLTRPLAREQFPIKA